MSERLVLKPTPWFLFRAVAMLLMFGIFAAMFYKDGSHGYRDQNYVYYLSKAFKTAREDFTAGRHSATPGEWAGYAKEQKVP
ncbi:hypothetical protein, partial [Haloferula sp. BvORR071]|uniref:hypothetical protein n=1 Tax=Haloferula sp. BvORR071 TaxID=1396141 RepID=UPI0005594BBD